MPHEIGAKSANLILGDRAIRVGCDRLDELVRLRATPRRGRLAGRPPNAGGLDRLARHLDTTSDVEGVPAWGWAASRTPGTLPILPARCSGYASGPASPSRFAVMSRSACAASG